MTLVKELNPIDLNVLVATLGNWSNMSFVQRDLFRVSLGLEPLNRVFTNQKCQEVVFRRTGRCKLWSKPPEHYRFAQIEEVPHEAFEVLQLPGSFFRPLILTRLSDLNYDYGWAKLILEGGKIHHEGVVIVNRFKEDEFHVPLIRM